MTATQLSKPSASLLDELAQNTPAHRDRAIDALRAFSIVVVVAWHWTLSVTHRNAAGALTMPNPIGNVALLWVATWGLQVMPLFFVVGGYSNRASWVAKQRNSVSGMGFVRSRLARLTRPTAVFIATWALFAVVLRTNPLVWGRALFVPLWFVGAYAVVCAMAPWMSRWFDRSPLGSVVVLLVTVASLDAARLLLGIEAARWPLTFATWLFCHQLGFHWRDAGTDATRNRNLRNLALAAGLGLALLCIHGLGYDHSLVAVRGAGRSNMAPPSLPIAAAAMLQLGLAMTVAPRLRRRLASGRAWRTVIAANSVAMTVLVWHMTAYFFAALIFERLGGRLGDQPTASWWMTRPLWVLAPAVFLVPLVAVFRRLER